MDMSKFKDGSVHFINSGWKELIFSQYKSIMSIFFAYKEICLFLVGVWYYWTLCFTTYFDMLCNMGKKPLVSYANNEGPDKRAHLCSLIWTDCSSTYTILSIDSVCGQQRPRSACTNVQADQGQCCPQIV